MIAVTAQNGTNVAGYLVKATHNATYPTETTADNH